MKYMLLICADPDVKLTLASMVILSRALSRAASSLSSRGVTERELSVRSASRYLD